MNSVILCAFYRRGRRYRVAVLCETRIGMYMAGAGGNQQSIRGYRADHWFSSIAAAQDYVMWQAGVPRRVWFSLDDLFGDMPQEPQAFYERMELIARSMLYIFYRSNGQAQTIFVVVLKKDFTGAVQMTDDIQERYRTLLPLDYVDWLLYAEVRDALMYNDWNRVRRCYRRVTDLSSAAITLHVEQLHGVEGPTPEGGT
ncbi:MAG: hypothetical protein AAFV33_05765 [Chloroflexota bacterium]